MKIFKTLTTRIEPKDYLIVSIASVVYIVTVLVLWFSFVTYYGIGITLK
jgi:hypothetical protein